MKCQDFASEPSKCKYLRANFSGCECESVKVSPHSPGQVQNDEILVRFILVKAQLDDEGRPTPMAFTDVETIGLSVNRLSHTNTEEMKRKVHLKLENDRREGKDRDFMGVIKVLCGDVRGLVCDQKFRTFCVYDTANIDDISQADICQEGRSQEGRSKASQWRRRLKTIFSEKVEDL
jgi:hypothetical protein